VSAVLQDLARLKDPTSAPVIHRLEAIRRARAALAPSLAGRQAPHYPQAALGPLAAACEAIADKGQVQAAMAGQCLLGAASLLTQGLFNVQTLNGRKPLSLYALTLGDSGDGKSTAQGAALAPVTEWQRQVAKRYGDDLKAYEKDKAIRKRGEEPSEAPGCPYRLVGDATVEGLRRDLDGGVCSQGVFTDEAAAILSGYGMSADHRAKTAGVFSKLWDDGHLSVSRVTGGRVERYGRRLALHWLVQPTAASQSIGDPLLASLGFWPRFLAAWPEPQEPRLARAFCADRSPAISAYWQRCNELLDMLLPNDAGDCPVIELDEDARRLLHPAFESFERSARRGALKTIKPFGLRASEQACRIAGVLTAIQGRQRVSAEAMTGGLSLVAYSLATWHAIIDEGAADQRGAHALRLYEWLTMRPGWAEKLSVIVNAGPPATRMKDARDAALSMLEGAGLVCVVNGTATALIPLAE
jgi:hypothetical protein